MFSNCVFTIDILLLLFCACGLAKYSNNLQVQEKEQKSVRFLLRSSQEEVIPTLHIEELSHDHVPVPWLGDLLPHQSILKKVMYMTRYILCVN